MKLDIACGLHKPEGFVGVDICKTPAVDVQWNLLHFPWPFAAESVDEARCSHFFEHVPARKRPQFMSELWRILKPGGTATFFTPHAFTRQVQDFSHEWPPIVYASYAYYNQPWLKEWNLSHYRDLYGIDCNFHVDLIGVSVCKRWQGETDEKIDFAITHYVDATEDLAVKLTKLPMESQ